MVIATKKATPKATKAFTAEEREAMEARAAEMKAARGKGKVDGEAEVLAKIAELKEPDRAMATRIHAIVKQAAPSLESKTWYGMPAYAKGGKTICFFQSAHKFKTRYATFGFSDQAKLDDGNMWPNSFALTKLTAADEARIATLVKKAVG
ncbi:MAG: DUF1801 domain-containing protein [Devosia sp.]|nr:DUF1801 domain-containing protein [Devosia sp.]